MEVKSLKLAILNLTGEFPKELKDYFAERQIQVIDPLVSDEKLDWTHIITKDIHDFALMRKTYQTTEKDIKIVSLTRVSDPQNFILSNGKLVLDEIWMKGALGSFILDKFFQEYAGISLGDNYPKFQEKGSFNISNPFSTGEYLDRLVHHAFSENYSGLSIKTYFDHLIMYLTGLKNKGKVGLPIEVIYGSFDDVFGLQVHFFANGLLLDDITCSLSNSSSKKAEEHLLNVSVHSADFFDFTFLSEVKKVVVTGLWSKDERITIENQGLMFTNLTNAATIQQLSYEGATSQLIDQAPLTDISEKISLAGLEEEEKQTISGEDLSEALAEKISGEIDLDQVKEILSGDILEEDPTKIVLGSNDDMKELINLVKGKIEEEADVFKVNGGKLDVDNFAMRISAGIKEKAPGMMNVVSLGDKLPETIKTGLFSFASKLNKDVKDLNNSDIHIFKSTEIPQILKSTTVIGNQLSKKIRQEIKSKLEQGLMSEFMEDSAEKALASLNGKEDEMRLKELLKTTLKSSLENNFQLTQKEQISDIEKDLLVKSLSVSLSEDENKIREIVRVESSHTADKPLFISPPSAKEAELQSQLEAVLEDNGSLKSKMKMLMVEVKILKESRVQMAGMNAQAKQNASTLATGPTLADQDKDLRKHFQDRLGQDELLSQQEQQKLSMLMEREAKLIETVKEKEIEARKIQLEATQKETIFAQELEKANRQLKNKDLLISKSKEVLMKAVEKKDSEIKGLQMKVNELGHALNSGASSAQANQLKNLQKQNQNMAKMVEMYRGKLGSMIGNLKANKDDDGNSKEEVRKLQMLNNQFKNQVDSVKKELQKYQDKVAYDQTQMSNLRAEKSKLEQQIKLITQEVRKVQVTPVSNELEHEYKKAQTQNQILENQLKDITIRLKDTETRLTEALKNPQKQAVNQVDDKRSGHLEASVKKLNQDVMEARAQAAEMKKETTKLRQDKTALQNQIDKLKREMEKSSKAAPPKKDSGGKAA